jgi:hypothetical protein
MQYVAKFRLARRTLQEFSHSFLQMRPAHYQQDIIEIDGKPVEAKDDAEAIQYASAQLTFYIKTNNYEEGEVLEIRQGSRVITLN